MNAWGSHVIGAFLTGFEVYPRIVADMARDRKPVLPAGPPPGH